MVHNKKTEEGLAERLALLSPIFPEIQRHLADPQPRVGADDLLDAAAAAWTALKRNRGERSCVCTSKRDEKGLSVAIFY